MRQLSYLLFISFLSTFTQKSIAQCNHPNDYTALRALYLGTGGDRWTDNINWPDSVTFANNPTPPAGTDLGSWFGIG
ncbi:MAG: hypothetical protein AAF599_21270, partial [Bacteroidota bacterium]